MTEEREKLPKNSKDKAGCMYACVLFTLCGTNEAALWGEMQEDEESFFAALDINL